MNEQLAAGADIAWHDTGDQVVLMTLGDGRFHLLEGTARAIWLLALEGRSRKQISDDLAGGAPLDVHEVEAAVANFVEDLLRRRLLRHHP